MLTRLHCAGLLAGWLALAQARPSGADELSRRLDDPRSVGRAGTSTVSSDSGAALLNNPGGMVRRSQRRLVLATGLADRDASFASATSTASPTIDNRAGPQTTPMIAFHQGDADDGRWVLGLALFHGQVQSSLPTPAFGQPAADVERLFPHRYGGTDLLYTWRTFAAGAAIRIGESLGLGASASISQISLRETRRVWAGFAGRDTLLGAERDLELVLRGKDLGNPGASVGALVAPPDLPFEFALSLEYRRGARLRDRNAELNETSAEAFPSASTSDATSRITLKDSLIMRSGVRYLGTRSFVELGADYQVQAGRSREDWRIEGMDVLDESTAQAEITSVPALLHSRSHLALRAALDYEVVPGFLWLTGGYAWTSPSSPRAWRTPIYAELGGHIMAAGLEATYENFVLSLGYARALERKRSVTSSNSDAEAFNPFAAGTAAANVGTYRTASDELGFALELSWD